MDSIIAAAARALAGGDALGALNRVALREDPPALALRGIAMAQLGEHGRARKLLQRASRGFGAHEALARARCVAADAEVALATRDLAGPARTLTAAIKTLEAHGDRANALHARLTAVRRALIVGRLDEAAKTLGRIDLQGMPPVLATVAELARAELALRSMNTREALASLAYAAESAARARVPALQAEVEEARAALQRPAARRLNRDHDEMLRLDQVESLLGSGALVVDACRRGVRAGKAWIPLASRPILFVLARALAEKWPGDVPRAALIERAFNARRQDETHRARLRVEIGRLRALIKDVAGIESTQGGFAIAPRMGSQVVVLAPPIDGEAAAVLALLADGAAWSTSSLALALNASQRTVQRALSILEEKGQVRSIGKARARRWLAPPIAGFATNLLLPPLLPAG
jgi:DNA-binding transcriptional ArsR family regulator